MGKKLTVLSLVAVLALNVSSPALAHEGEDNSGPVGSAVRNVEKKVEDTVHDETETKDDNGGQRSLSERLRLQRSQIEDRKTELKQELEKKRTERKEKLEGRRLAQCQNREDTINNLMGKSASVGKQRLARIQRFEEGVKAFYEKQGLSSQSYQAAVDTVDEKEAAAIAAVDTYGAQKFDCDTVDVNDSNGDIRSNREAAKQSLQAYRASVVNLLHIVKDAFQATKAESGTSEGNE